MIAVILTFVNSLATNVFCCLQCYLYYFSAVIKTMGREGYTRMKEFRLHLRLFSLGLMEICVKITRQKICL